MRKIALHWLIIFGLILGIIWALIASALGWSKFTIDWIYPWGKIFINLLKLIAVPLVLFSIIKGVSGLSDISRLGRLGAKTLLTYLVTTVTAVSLGLVLVNTIQPGKLISEDQRISNYESYQQFIQKNGGGIIAEDQVSKDGEKDAFLQEKMEQAEQTKDKGPLEFLVDIVPQNIFFSLNDNSLMLQVIFFAIFFGIALLTIPKDKAKPLVDFVDGANEVFLRMVDIVMKGAPFFVFALLAGKVAEMAKDNPESVIEIFKGLGWYSLTVFAGLVIMAFIFYPLLVRLISKKMTYRRFFKSIGPAQMLAFSTSSSAATLPVTMECVRDNLGVSKEVTSFVLPIGATVNMDGTSLYQAIAVVFLAQLHMVDLDLSQQLTIVLMATLASIGSAAVPSAGLIMLIIVLGSVGLDPAWIAIIFPVDRILDMCRTVVNVTGDATVATLIASTEGESLQEPVNQ